MKTPITVILKATKFISIFIISLLPFLLNLSQFKALFWFGDELVLLGEMRREGLFQWTAVVFAESIVPIFKLLWGGSVILSHGSYFEVVTSVWLTHALNATLLFFILQRVGVSFLISLFSVCIFALTPGTHESLGWTVQWSAILVVTFFLLGLTSILTITSEAKRNIFAVLCAFGAAFSFARGVLVCGILSIGIFFSSNKSIKQKLFFSFLPIIPALIAAWTIFHNSSGNHQSLLSVNSETIFKMIDFGGTFYLLNPLFRIFYDTTPELNHYLMFGSLKIALLCLCLFALKKGTKEQKLLICLPILFDLGNAALLGLGRYHTGSQFAVSSRYQYESLMCLSMSLGVSLHIFLGKAVAWRKEFIFAILILGTFSLTRWNTIMKEWGKSRGSEGRDFFFVKPDKRPDQWWGLPNIISKEEAEETIKFYDLH